MPAATFDLEQWAPPTGEAIFRTIELSKATVSGQIDVTDSDDDFHPDPTLDLSSFPPPSEDSRLILEESTIAPVLLQSAWGVPVAGTHLELFESPLSQETVLDELPGPLAESVEFEDKLENAVLESVSDLTTANNPDDVVDSYPESMANDTQVIELERPFESLDGLGSLTFEPGVEPETTAELEPASVDQVDHQVEQIAEIDQTAESAQVAVEPAPVTVEQSQPTVGTDSLLSARSVVDQLFNISSGGLALVTCDGRFDRVSPAFASLFGLLPVFLEGRPLSMVFQPIEMPGLLSAIGTCVDPSTRLQAGAVQAIKSNGEPVVLSMTIAGFDAGTTERRVVLSASLVPPPAPVALPAEAEQLQVDQDAEMAGGRTVDLVDPVNIAPLDVADECAIAFTALPAEDESVDRNTFPKRAGFRESAESILELTLRANELAHLIVIDVSDFKDVVARFGETAGDAILRDASEAVMALIGPHDVAGRLSGSELGVLLTRRDSSGEQVQKFVERLRTRANALTGQRNREWNLNFTTGVAAAGPFNRKSIAQLLEQAEQARRNDAAQSDLASSLT